jgi:hypothetical protein
LTPTYTVKNPLCGNGLLGQAASIYGLIFSVVAGIVSGALGAYGVLWIDGERSIKGGFSPFESRGVSRVSRGNLLLGAAAFFVIGGIVSLVALMMPWWIQVVATVIVLAAAALLGYVKFIVPG